MGYRKNLENVARRYSETLSMTQIFLLNCWAEKEVNRLCPPPIDGVISTWSQESKKSASKYYEEALEIYKKHLLVKTVIHWIIGFGLIWLVKKIIGISFAVGQADGAYRTLDAIKRAAEKAVDEGKEGFDLIRFRDNDGEDWTYVHALVKDEAMDPKDYS